jgi:hypothetical protein
VAHGWPTVYFLLQGAGVLFERTDLAGYGVGRGGRGRWFALMVVAVPIAGLFHPPFVLNVIVPFLKIIGAL